jgi:hypothetical protein
LKHRPQPRPHTVIFEVAQKEAITPRVGEVSQTALTDR